MKFEVIFKCHDCGKHHDWVQMDTLNDAIAHMRDETRPYIYIEVIEYKEPNLEQAENRFIRDNNKTKE